MGCFKLAPLSEQGAKHDLLDLVALYEFSWLPQGVISTKQQRVTHGKFLRMGVCT
jgi:hypothetical protein